VAVREPSYAGALARSSGSPSEPFDPLTAPLSVVEAASRAGSVDAGSVDAGSVDTEASAPADETKPTGWPCTRCDQIVPFDEAACPNCGTAFLAGATGQPDLVERLGSRGISTSTQVMIIACGSFALIAVIVGFMYFIGLFL
jgi:hypothetical protein